ncbi:sigma-54-dependent Fis family transcriptional regulator [Olivibacter domesticus]|uniref:DNA-binding protein Fis n=1 Tax=Olivibacter domesticus TaxID=407022 RepID=A0A1H7ZD98_OLID1|nr:sigma 54-interacting transcriptional regulator [Olivibacter domesticus]SEM55964.1 DNA-binding protein Fis [Olivibacter domesticus]
MSKVNDGISENYMDAESILPEDTMIRLSQSLATIRTKEAFQLFLREKLYRLVPFKEGFISTFDQTTESYKPYFTSHLFKQLAFDEQAWGTTLAVGSSAINEVIDSRGLQGHVLTSRMFEQLVESGHFFEISKELLVLVGCRLQAGDHIVGFLCLVLNKSQYHANYAEKLLARISGHLSTVLANILALEQLSNRDREQAALLEISNDFAAIKDSKDFLDIVNNKLKKLFNFSHSVLSLITEDGQYLYPYIFDPKNPNINHQLYDNAIKLKFPTTYHIFKESLEKGTVLVYKVDDLLMDEDAPVFIKINHDNKMREMAVLALGAEGSYVGFIQFWTRVMGAFSPSCLEIIGSVSQQVAIALSNLLAKDKIAEQLAEIERYKKKLEDQNVSLQEELSAQYKYSEIVGEGGAINSVFKAIGQVASSDSTVLIIGETGTGKELIAKEIHNRSKRSTKLMVKINCAAIPLNLIESELFGHEKGSFTGAGERKLGKFELADGGTLFLDEVGEMPMEVQSKLLRVLQEREIERIGANFPISIDVRIIAATNRNLLQSVASGNFRADLFYRLNVFPIVVPPLRERKGDIRILVNHFLEKHGKKIGRKIMGISKQVLHDFRQYDWPGNVRELEHVIERSILMTSQPIITEVYLPNSKTDRIVSFLEDLPPTLALEKNHITQVLQQCGGKVSGSGGAAEVLGMPPSTLFSKLKRLGIKRNYSM